MSDKIIRIPPVIGNLVDAIYKIFGCEIGFPCQIQISKQRYTRRIPHEKTGEVQLRFPHGITSNLRIRSSVKCDGWPAHSVKIDEIVFSMEMKRESSEKLIQALMQQNLPSDNFRIWSLPNPNYHVNIFLKGAFLNKLLESPNMINTDETHIPLALERLVS